MLRVVHQENHTKRALIRNLKDDIKDIAFAYSSDEVILGCVDCEGNILIYNIEDSEDALRWFLLPWEKIQFLAVWCFLVTHYSCMCSTKSCPGPKPILGWPGAPTFRAWKNLIFPKIWRKRLSFWTAPRVRCQNNFDGASITEFSTAEIYNVATLVLKYGGDGPIDPDNSYDGYTEINHTADLVDASFSSDGCAIALACKDGFVKFFQVRHKSRG